MLIFLFAFLSSINVFLHYGLLNSDLRGPTFFMIEMFRFTIFFFITYYYCDRASGLLPNKKLIKIFLRLLFIMSIIFILAIGGILIKIQPENLCSEALF